MAILISSDRMTQLRMPQTQANAWTNYDIDKTLRDTMKQAGQGLLFIDLDDVANCHIDIQWLRCKLTSLTAEMPGSYAFVIAVDDRRLKPQLMDMPISTSVIHFDDYTSDELMANRARFETEVRARLDESMNQEGFIVREFTTKIDPPASLTEAINAKNEAVQNALKAENKVKEAEAEAKIEIAKAEGVARALKIKGDGEAYYKRVVSASLNALLVQQYAIEKWNGELPTYNGTGALPFIDLKK